MGVKLGADGSGLGVVSVVEIAGAGNHAVYVQQACCAVAGLVHGVLGPSCLDRRSRSASKFSIRVTMYF